MWCPRPFHICYREDGLTDLGRDFIKFILSAEGQAIVGEKYIAVGGGCRGVHPSLA